MTAIRTVDLTKKFGQTAAVDKLNLEINKGELFSLLGVNGAGKTTAVRMLSCTLTPTEGEAFLNGFSILHDSPRIKELIGVSPQETAVAPSLTVRENIYMMCRIHGFSRRRTEEKVKELSETLSLNDVLSKRADKLSGGMKRRVSIAMALAGEPEILFLDEPTLGLDVISRSELWEFIERMKGKVTVILTTHYMEEAQKLSDRIGIMKDGKLLFVGTSRELSEKTGKEKFEDAFISVVKGERI